MADRQDTGPERFSAYVVIPAPIYFNADIKPRAKMLYGLLSCMSNERGYAFPRNETLQRYLGGVSEDTVSRTLKELVDAGAIFVEGGSGGSPKNIRKIYLGEVYPASLRKNADPSLRKNADPSLRKNADPDNNSKNNKRKNNTARPTEEEIKNWFSLWATRRDYGQELTTPLISDLFAFAESRKAKGKPILTIRSASMLANKLVSNVAMFGQAQEQVARMRYMLQGAITHNWESVYPIKDDFLPDYYLWRAQEYGIPVPGAEPEAKDYF